MSFFGWLELKPLVQVASNLVHESSIAAKLQWAVIGYAQSLSIAYCE